MGTAGLMSIPGWYINNSIYIFLVDYIETVWRTWTRQKLDARLHTGWCNTTGRERWPRLTFCRTLNPRRYGFLGDIAVECLRALQACSSEIRH